MTAHVTQAPLAELPAARPRYLRVAVPVGRVFFAAIFVISAFGHFRPDTVAYAAESGVPMAGLAVPLSGVIALLGGLSVMLGFKARAGALLVALFLVPVTVMMHPFWTLGDPQAAMAQQTHFLKNLSMLGGALLLLYFGAGPMSVDARRRPRVAG